MAVVLLVVVIWVACIGFAALLADRKGRSMGWFALAGLLLGPIGLLWAASAFPREDIELNRQAWRSRWRHATSRYWIGQ